MTAPPATRVDAATDQRLPRALRLRRRREFLALQGRGVRAHGRLLVLVAGRGPQSGPRLGITASKKVGGAVQRNRAKRLVREAFRRHCRTWPAWLELVSIARPELVRAHLLDVEQDLQQAVARALQLLQRRGGRGSRRPQAGRDDGAPPPAAKPERH